MYAVEILTAPDSLPVTAEQLRKHLGLNDDSEDEELAEWIAAAVERFEVDTRRPVLATVCRRTWHDRKARSCSPGQRGGSGEPAAGGPTAVPRQGSARSSSTPYRFGGRKCPVAGSVRTQAEQRCPALESHRFIAKRLTMLRPHPLGQIAQQLGPLFEPCGRFGEPSGGFGVHVQSAPPFTITRVTCTSRVPFELRKTL